MTISAVMNSALSGLAAQEARALRIARNVANASTPGYRRLDPAQVAPGQAGLIAGAGAARRLAEPPEWPDLSEIDLPAEIMALTRTQIACTANLAVLETGADFWDMLATAFEQGEGKRA